MAVDNTLRAGPPVRVWRMLGGAAALCWRQAPVLLALSAVSMLPRIALVPAFPAVGPTALSGMFVLGMVLTYIAGATAQAALVPALYRALTGEPRALGRSLAGGPARLLPAVATQFCASIATMIGFVLLVIPGLIVATMLCVALPACIVERRGPLDSLRRSRALSKGHRWRLFGMLLLAGTVSVLPTAGLSIAGALTGGAIVPPVLTMAWTVLGHAFGVAVVLVAYRDLRVALDGGGGDRLVAVFD